MQEYLFNPITLICLGTIFILVSLLFFYFKRTISVLEKAQMDQARVLQSFITNMEMSNIPYNKMANPSEIPIHHQSTLHTEEELIEVSDDESSDDDDDDDSDDDDETVVEILHTNVEELEKPEDTVKVIHLDNDTLEEVAPLIIESLDEIDEESYNGNKSDSDSDSDNDSDSDSDSDSESDKNEINKIDENSNVSEQPSIAEQLNIVKQVFDDYKTLTVVALRELAESENLIEKGEKKSKKELIKLLEESK